MVLETIVCYIFFSLWFFLQLPSSGLMWILCTSFANRRERPNQKCCWHLDQFLSNVLCFSFSASFSLFEHFPMFHYDFSTVAIFGDIFGGVLIGFLFACFALFLQDVFLCAPGICVSSTRLKDSHPFALGATASPAGFS